MHDGQETEEFSMSALLDKVASLEEEVSTLKKELSDSQTKLKVYTYNYFDLLNTLMCQQN